MVNKRNNLFLVSTIIMLLFLTIISNPIKVAACDCDIPDSANEALQSASAVFTGEVLTIKEATVDGEKYNAVLISVSDTWKGTKDTQVIIYTGWSSCQFDFEVGKEYLIYANEHDGKLEVINCGRSAEINAAKKDLIELGDGEAPTVDVKLDDEFDSFNIVKIVGIFLVIAGIFTFILWRTLKKRP